MCLRDRAGNHTRVTKTVTVDLTDPTGNMDIDRGADYAVARAVTVNLSAAADVTQMKVLNVGAAESDINCVAEAGYGPLDLAYAHQLTAGDGVKFVRVCLRDAAGRWVKLPRPDRAYAITLDATPPALADPGSGSPDGVWVESGAAITGESLVEVTVGAADATSGVAEFKLSEGGACRGGGWQEWRDDGSGRMSTQFSVGQRRAHRLGGLPRRGGQHLRLRERRHRRGRGAADAGGLRGARPAG